MGRDAAVLNWRNLDGDLAGALRMRGGASDHRRGKQDENGSDCAGFHGLYPHLDCLIGSRAIDPVNRSGCAIAKTLGTSSGCINDPSRFKDSIARFYLRFKDSLAVGRKS